MEPRLTSAVILHHQAKKH